MAKNKFENKNNEDNNNTNNHRFDQRPVQSN